MLSPAITTEPVPLCSSAVPPVGICRPLQVASVLVSVVVGVLDTDTTCWPGSGSAQMRKPPRSQAPEYPSPSTAIRSTLVAATPGPPLGTASSTQASPAPPVIA